MPQVDQVLVDEVFTAGTGDQRVSDELLWLMADHQGTIRDILDGNATLRKHLDYDSFGNVTGEEFYSEGGSTVSSGHAEAIDQHFYYTGQEWDSDAELYNYNARWYEPTTGKIPQRGSFRLRWWRSQSLSLRGQQPEQWDRSHRLVHLQADRLLAGAVE